MERRSIVARFFRFVSVLVFGFVLGAASLAYYLHVNDMLPGGIQGLIAQLRHSISTLDFGGQQQPRQVVPQTPASTQPGATAQVHLLDFGAEWCGPCKIIEPVIDSLASRYSGRVAITKIDIDKNPSLADRYQIRGVPTLVVEKNGRQFTRLTGAQHSESDIAAILDAALQ